MKVLSRGAEAIIYKESESVVLKKRISKGYRIKQLDDKLISKRTKSEAKILSKLEKIAPKMLSTDNKSQIKMSFIKGKVLRDCLNKDLAKKIAVAVSFMHDKDIVHCDLTTSNMILGDDESIKIIDFGLSLVSKRIEDKAVDLHLFKESLISKHYEIYEDVWNNFIKNYDVVNKEDILLRLEKVELRGKNKK